MAHVGGETTRPYNPLWSSAQISDCGRYRYRVERRWAEGGWTCVFIAINPSTADQTFDDATLLRCVSFAKSWGASAVVIVNLFSLRSTDPLGLLEEIDPVGPANDVAIMAAVTDPAVGRAICAWGTHSKKALRLKIEARAFVVKTLLRQRGLEAVCLGTTKNHAPKHPLYLAADVEPIPFVGGAA